MWILDACVVIVIVMFFIFLNCMANERFYNQANCFPGPKVLPLIGNAHLFSGKDLTSELNTLTNKNIENVRN